MLSVQTCEGTSSRNFQQTVVGNIRRILKEGASPSYVSYDLLGIRRSLGDLGLFRTSQLCFVPVPLAGSTLLVLKTQSVFREGQ